VAVNTRILFGSLAAAVVVSVAGGYVLSTSTGSSSPASVTDDVTIGSAGTYLEPAGIPTNNSVQGKKLPAVRLTDASAASISTADLLGHPLVINVWSTTCEPCKRELPAFAKIHQELGDTVRFVGINEGDSVATARDFAKKYGVNYEALSDPDGEFLVSLGISGLPYTLFVAADGTIVAQKGVELTADVIRSTITDKLLS
jgi:thiol-disulfide isomerase/thioredoxin